MFDATKAQEAILQHQWRATWMSGELWEFGFTGLSSWDWNGKCASFGAFNSWRVLTSWSLWYFLSSICPVFAVTVRQTELKAGGQRWSQMPCWETNSANSPRGQFAKLKNRLVSFWDWLSIWQRRGFASQRLGHAWKATEHHAPTATWLKWTTSWHRPEVCLLLKAIVVWMCSSFLIWFFEFSACVGPRWFAIQTGWCSKCHRWCTWTRIRRSGSTMRTTT